MSATPLIFDLVFQIVIMKLIDLLQKLFSKIGLTNSVYNLTLLNKCLCQGTLLMEQRALKNVNSCLNTNIYSYLETSGGQSYIPYLNVVHFFHTSVNYTYVAA